MVKNAVLLANALAERGCRVTLLACSLAGHEGYGIDPAVTLVSAGQAGGKPAIRAVRLAMALPALRRALKRIGPDVLLSAGNHGHWAALAASAAMPGLARMLRISSGLEHYGDGFIRRGLRRAGHRLVLACAQRLLLVSPHLARDPLLAAALAAGRAELTPNGIAAEEVRRRAAEPFAHPWLAGSTPLVVTLARLVPAKNLATLLRALALAVKQRPIRLVIAGGGSARARRRLERLALKLGIAQLVRFEGELANPLPLLAGANGFVLPSLWEGCSNALLEALALGVPVVAARTAGNAQELLDHGRFGLLVDPLDAAAMAKAMLYQLSATPVRPQARAGDFPAAAAIARCCCAITRPLNEGRLPWWRAARDGPAGQTGA